MQLETQIKVKNLDALPSMLRKIVLFIILHLCFIGAEYVSFVVIAVQKKESDLKTVSLHCGER